MNNDEAKPFNKSWQHRFGRVVAIRRRELGLTQEQLAYESGLHRTYIGSLERGLRNPTITTAVRPACGLQMSVSELFLRVENTEE